MRRPTPPGLEDGRALLAEGAWWGTTPSEDLTASPPAVARGAGGDLPGTGETRGAHRDRQQAGTLRLHGVREVKRNTTPVGYRAHRADRMAQVRTRRPRPAKLASNDPLRNRVEEGLKAKWSPQQIAARLRLDFPEDPTMRLSHETIYTSLFVQAKAGLPGQLTVHLRTRRVRRRAQRRVFVGPRRIADMLPLEARPAEVDARLVIGHWEGDLIVGRRSRSHIGTLVERHSRYVVLLQLPSSRTDDVIEILTATVADMPEELQGTLTWDQGNEMTKHALFTRTTGIPVFFCEPRSPWQRGSNENTNGLLRQYS